MVLCHGLIEAVSYLEKILPTNRRDPWFCATASLKPGVQRATGAGAPRDPWFCATASLKHRDDIPALAERMRGDPWFCATASLKLAAQLLGRDAGCPR